MADSNNSPSKIEHIVVLMLESRSFDHVLGWLYDPANAAPFDVVPADFEGLYGRALSLSNPRSDWPTIVKPKFYILEDIEAEMHTIAHAKLLGAKQKPVSDLQRNPLHGSALFTQAGQLHERIEELQNELEADLLVIEHEAKLVKNKFLGNRKPMPANEWL